MGELMKENVKNNNENFKFERFFIIFKKVVGVVGTEPTTFPTTFRPKNRNTAPKTAKFAKLSGCRVLSRYGIFFSSIIKQER